MKGTKAWRALVGGLVVLMAAAGVWALVHGVDHVARDGETAAVEHDVATDAEGDGLNGLEAYWNDRLTYPTGRFNQRWVIAAAKQAKRIKAGIPQGHYRASRSTRVTGVHGAQSIKALAA